jgi:protein gp37
MSSLKCINSTLYGGAFLSINKEDNMNRTKIEWANFTWNPLTGCHHGCGYCYAKRIARRFCSNEFGNKDGLLKNLHCAQGCQGCSEMDGLEFVGQKIRFAIKGQRAFPYGFLPTFYSNRLDEPQKVKKPSTIFVVSMGDLFGDWVPDECIQAVFDACDKAPQHRYIFLTKNPGRLDLLQYHNNLPVRPNFWFGTTVVGNQGEPEPVFISSALHNAFVSCEPLLNKVSVFSLLYSAVLSKGVKWIIIGAQTGPGAAQHQPRREWVGELIECCHEKDIPVFLKNNLQRIWKGSLPQKYPW